MNGDLEALERLEGLEPVSIIFNKQNDFMVSFKNSHNLSFLINKEVKLSSKIHFLSKDKNLDEKKFENLKCLFYEGADFVIDLLEDKLGLGESFTILENTRLILEANNLNYLENYEIILYLELEHTDEIAENMNISNEKLFIQNFLEEDLLDEEDEEDFFSQSESDEESENFENEEDEEYADLLEEANELNKDNEFEICDESEYELENEFANNNNGEKINSKINSKINDERYYEKSSFFTNNIKINPNDYVKGSKKYMLRRKRKAEYNHTHLGDN
jgi:hypothetical protein